VQREGECYIRYDPFIHLISGRGVELESGEIRSASNEAVSKLIGGAIGVETSRGTRYTEMRRVSERWRCQRPSVEVF
jgi:hypothetical protein